VSGTAYLERALIGALLNDPVRADGLPALSPADFTDPLCRAIWPTLTVGAAPGSRPAGPVNVTELAGLLADTAAHLHPHTRSVSAVAELEVNAPLHPHPDVYARLIIDATARRQILALGYRLTQLDPGHPEQTLSVIDDVTDRLHRLSAQLNNPVHDPIHNAVNGIGNAVNGTDHEPVTRTPAAGVRLVTADAQRADAEWAIVGALVHDHPRGARMHIQQVLTPADLTFAPAISTWTAVTRLQQAGLPVDEITVYWRLTHTRAGCTPTVDQLHRSRDFTLGYQEAIRSIAADSITRTARALHAEIHTIVAEGGDGPLAQTDTGRLLHNLTSTASDLRRKASHLTQLTPAAAPSHQPTPDARHLPRALPTTQLPH